MASRSTPVSPNAGTRERLVLAMLDALRRKGYRGAGLNELLAEAKAPKGVLYHHFPGGKSALAVAAIEQVMAQLLAALDRLLLSEPDPSRALAGWMGSAQKTLAASGFKAGCPLATIALESTPEDTAIRQALADGFASLRERLSLGLQQAGIDHGRADGLAALMVSAYEGALVQARVAGGVEVMRRTTDALAELLRHSLPKTR